VNRIALALKTTTQKAASFEQKAQTQTTRDKRNLAVKCMYAAYAAFLLNLRVDEDYILSGLAAIIAMA
jgi:hypothetical protein